MSNTRTPAEDDAIKKCENEFMAHSTYSLAHGMDDSTLNSFTYGKWDFCSYARPGLFQTEKQTIEACRKQAFKDHQDCLSKISKK